MKIFFVGRGRTRVYGETYLLYVAAENPRRTPHNGKKTIYGWKLANLSISLLVSVHRISVPRSACDEPFGCEPLHRTAQPSRVILTVNPEPLNP
jgi:hypothetical protein